MQKDHIRDTKLGLDMLQRRGIIEWWDTKGTQVQYSWTDGPAGCCTVSWSAAAQMLGQYDFIR